MTAVDPVKNLNEDGKLIGVRGWDTTDDDDGNDDDDDDAMYMRLYMRLYMRYYIYHNK